MQPDERLIQPRFKESLDRYVEHGRPTGGFLDAVLANDLSEAVFRADGEALGNIPHIVAYVYHSIPGDAWGSHDVVAQWVREKREARGDG